ncbi:hypothetical protein NDS46_31325 (plasmid) [Paenibacillus thiaminolyticus]|uniref:hypothetical protein n=1 Tax=Paenibacillus thiaminolyticus TaxID=49283 RepID=UPI002330A7EC|nr:hypothetical protein [Paenibacillus thiaminolyticus]WCF11450.1 hypothetical protein NDS46_31325 [Paenibacillus thiaminolyticus]
MKMSHKKFVAMATTLGLSVGLLAGCVPNPTGNIKDDEDKTRSSSGGGAHIFPYGSTSSSSTNKSSESVGAVGGSKGIGSVKGGGAGS